MGFLGRLFGPRDQTLTVTTILFDRQRPDAVLAIVGESYRQEALERFVRTRDARGVTHGNLTALLMAEPTNPHDRNAVKVILRAADGTAAHVGYLGRDDAKLYGPMVRYLEPRVILARARLIGGWDDPVRGRGSIGVLLNLGSPSEVACEFVAASWTPPPQHRWAGAQVCFVGNSVHAACGIPMDRSAQQALAQRAGCSVHPRVTRKVQVAVLGSRSTASATLDKIREYSVETVAEDVFWNELGLRLEAG